MEKQFVSKQTTSSGMRVFGVIWFGQLVSIIGSGLTSFALGLWVYEQTGSATLYAFNLMALLSPNVLLSPLMGALWIDFATFLFAVATLLLIRIPRPKRSAVGTAVKGSLLREGFYGWTYIKARPGLLGLLLAGGI